jgi:phosphatidate cytidylyltransferase
MILRNFYVRLLSSLVLAPLALLVLWVGGPIYILCLCLVGLVIFSEWTRMILKRNRLCTALIGLVMLATLLAIYFDYTRLEFVLLSVIVLAALSGLFFSSAFFWGSFGLLYSIAMIQPLILLREDEAYGFIVLLALVTVVWTTDIAAYLGGRAIGGPKLWPRVSPKKTWAGFASGLCASLMAVTLLAWSFDWPITAGFVVLAICASLLSQMGDLFESGIKRILNAKDSGRIIPGHGGIMDRFDGLGMAGLGLLLIAMAVHFEGAPAATLVMLAGWTP